MRLQLRTARALLFVLGLAVLALVPVPARAQSSGGTAEVEPPPAGEQAPPPEPVPPPPAEPKEHPIRGSVDLRTGVYQDSNATTISTSTVAARALIKDRGTLEARYLVDVVSSASVDVVTAATGRISDLRQEVTAGGGYRDGTNTFSADYIFSTEHDWTSHTVSAGGSRDLLQHNLTLGLGASVGFNSVGRSGDMNFHRSLTTGGFTASMAYTLSPRDLLSVNYTFGYLSGYQASPYRYVIFFDNGMRASEPERVPDTRARHAVTARLHHHLFTNSALQVHARVYVDDWQVVSGTAGADYLIGVRDFIIAPHLRFYAQKAAVFYQATYMERLLYMTFDRELATFLDVFFGGRVAWARKHLGRLDELRAEVKVDGFYFYFFDFPRLVSRYGLTAELALGVSL